MKAGKQRRRPKFALILLITIYSVWLVIVVDITRALIVQFGGILPHCPRADYGSEKNIVTNLITTDNLLTLNVWSFTCS